MKINKMLGFPDVDEPHASHALKQASNMSLDSIFSKVTIGAMIRSCTQLAFLLQLRSLRQDGTGRSSIYTFYDGALMNIMHRTNYPI